MTKKQTFRQKLKKGFLFGLIVATGGKYKEIWGLLTGEEVVTTTLLFEFGGVVLLGILVHFFLEWI